MTRGDGVVTARAVSVADSLSLGPLTIGRVRSQSVTTYRQGRRPPATATELAIEGGRAGEVAFSFGREGFQFAQNGIPIPAGQGLGDAEPGARPRPGCRSASTRPARSRAGRWPRRSRSPASPTCPARGQGTFTIRMGGASSYITLAGLGEGPLLGRRCTDAAVDPPARRRTSLAPRRPADPPVEARRGAGSRRRHHRSRRRGGAFPAERVRRRHRPGAGGRRHGAAVPGPAGAGRPSVGGREPGAAPAAGPAGRGAAPCRSTVAARCAAHGRSGHRSCCWWPWERAGRHRGRPDLPAGPLGPHRRRGLHPRRRAAGARRRAACPGRRLRRQLVLFPHLRWPRGSGRPGARLHPPRVGRLPRRMAQARPDRSGSVGPGGDRRARITAGPAGWSGPAGCGPNRTGWWGGRWSSAPPPGWRSGPGSSAPPSTPRSRSPTSSPAGWVPWCSWPSASPCCSWPTPATRKRKLERIDTALQPVRLAAHRRGPSATPLLAAGHPSCRGRPGLAIGAALVAAGWWKAADALRVDRALDGLVLAALGVGLVAAVLTVGGVRRRRRPGAAGPSGPGPGRGAGDGPSSHRGPSERLERHTVDGRRPGALPPRGLPGPGGDRSGRPDAGQRPLGPRTLSPVRRRGVTPDA